MKAQRLLAITMLLLGRDSVSAPELAKRFEVSVRTIYRDMDALSEAGIPVVAYPGSGGGFGIMGEFKIDRSLLRPEEIGSLSATLGSLSSARGRKAAAGPSPMPSSSPGRPGTSTPTAEPATTSGSSRSPA